MKLALETKLNQRNIMNLKTMNSGITTTYPTPPP